MKRTGDLPPIPSQAFSHLGPVSVSSSKLEGLLGHFQPPSRTIELLEGQHTAQQWQTYWHECVHLALFDAGVKLPEKAEESVCDALGTYLAAAVRAGFIKVQPNEENDSPESGSVPDSDLASGSR